MHRIAAAALMLVVAGCADPWRECVLRLAMNDRLERLEMRSTYCFGGIGLLHCTPF
jgi:hypothetical protein